MELFGLPEVTDPVGLGEGCKACPRAGARGVKKILGEVRGRPFFVWAQSPGAEENRAGRELVGPSGKWLWRELAEAGIQRGECDVQNVMRCTPGRRDPKPVEIYQCSKHSDEFRAKSKARVWIVLGRVAGEALFPDLDRRPTVMWREGVCVMFLEHPSYFLRLDGRDSRRLRCFRRLLREARRVADRDESALHETGYLDDLRLTVAQTADEAEAAHAALLESIEGGAMKALAIDEEDWTDSDGQVRTSCVGFCPQPGDVTVFVLDHPGSPGTDQDRKAVKAVVRKLLTHPCVKAMHHGVYDDARFRKEFGDRAWNFEFDTQFAAFMYDPLAKSFALLSIADREYPQYSSYKDLVLPEAVPEGMSVAYARKTGQFDLSRVPLDKLVRYNAMDCHVTQLIVRDTSDHVPVKLVRAYTQASFTLDWMEKFGPWIDFQHVSKVRDRYLQRKESTAERIRDLAGEPGLNVNSQPALKRIIYNTWKRPKVGAKKDTSKQTLALLQQAHPHEGVAALQEYRQAKTRLERVEAFQRSAEAHAGRVTTAWWLTGTRTGRISSGGGTRGNKRALGNLQNVPSDPHVKDLLVSDQGWREQVTAMVRRAKAVGAAKAMDEFGDLDVFVARDYSQMELRIMAQVTGEPAMIKLFNRGVDIHAAIGSLWSEWSFRQLQTDHQKRRVVKGMHFGIIYGLGADGLRSNLLAQGIELPLRQVEGLMNAYWRRFKRVAAYRDRMPKYARKHGYVENIFGFRTPISPGSSAAFWKNQAVNSPIQGAAHQVLLCALALLEKHPDGFPNVHPQMEIHDSLVTVIELRNLHCALEETKMLLEHYVMNFTAEEFGIDWRVPLVTDAQIGFRYGCMVDVQPSLTKTLAAAIRKSRDHDLELARDASRGRPKAKGIKGQLWAQM